MQLCGCPAKSGTYQEHDLLKTAFIYNQAFGGGGIISLQYRQVYASLKGTAGMASEVIFGVTIEKPC